MIITFHLLLYITSNIINNCVKTKAIKMEDIKRSETPSPQRSRSSSRRRSNKDSTSTSPRHVKSIVVSMLKMKTFVGKYKTTQWVDCLGEYRETIQIEERDPIIPILADLQRRIRLTFPPNCWSGITLPGDLASCDGYCFWVLHADKLFDQHHYAITDIQFHDGEVKFTIKAEGKVVPDVSDSEQSVYDFLNTSKEVFQEKSLLFLQESWKLLTIENIKNSITFIGVLIATLGAAGVYLMDYFIRLIHAVTGLVKVSMPAVLEVLNIIQKIIGACFVFVAMIWKDLVRPQNHRREIRNENSRYIQYR